MSTSEMTVTEAAEVLRGNPRWVRKLIYEDKLPARWDGNQHWLPCDKVLAMRRAHERPEGYELTIAQCAKRLGLSVSRIRGLVREHTLDAVRHRGLVLISEESLRAELGRRRRQRRRTPVAC